MRELGPGAKAGCLHLGALAAEAGSPGPLKSESNGESPSVVSEGQRQQESAS